MKSSDPAGCACYGKELIMKTVFAVAFALFATLVSAEPPDRIKLPEIPAKYCETYYLHGQDSNDCGEVEQFSPAKAFGRIEAKQVRLAGGELLKIKSINQMERGGLLIRFEKIDFCWGLIEMPDSTLRIMQVDIHLKKRTTTFIVSQNKDRSPADLPSFERGTANYSETNSPLALSNVTVLGRDGRELSGAETEEFLSKLGGVGVVIDLVAEGAVVQKVLPDTPACAAGIKPRDIITEVDAEPVRGLKLPEISHRMRGSVGEEVVLTLLRKGQVEPFKLKLVRKVIPYYKDRTTCEGNH